MTTDQKYHRRLARKYGKRAAEESQWIQGDPEYRGFGSIYSLAWQAAWHAFKAHPELREVQPVQKIDEHETRQRISGFALAGTLHTACKGQIR